MSLDSAEASKQAVLETDGTDAFKLNYLPDNKLVKILAFAVFAFNSFHLKDCIEALRKLPKEQFETPWVHSLLARAHFEDVNYEAVCCIHVQSFLTIVLSIESLNHLGYSIL
jgi:hypothetical protein